MNTHKPTFVVLTVLLSVLLGALLMVAFVPKAVETEIVYVDRPVMAPVNVSGIQDQLTEISNIVGEDDRFEDLAFNLATEEWSRSGYRDVFEELTNVRDKEDIEDVVVTETEVLSVDAEDEDAKVTQELKVYYEDEDGDDKKVYLLVTTTVEDGDVVKQKFTVV